MSNKIGIEVQVEFPTVKELQEQLAKKWARVKNSFEGKINVGIDGNSLKQLKTQIQSVLDDKVFDIKFDTTGALRSIGKIKDELNELDKKLENTREIKIKYNIGDMDKTFRELLDNNQKIDKAVEEQNKRHAETNKQLDAQVGKATRIQRIQKQMKDGSWAITNRTTVDGGSGYQRTVTESPDGSRTIDETINRKKALDEIEAVLKRINRIEQEQVSVSGEHYQFLEKERRVQQEQLELLSEQYQQKHKINAMDDNSIQDLKRQQELNLEIKTTNALKKVQQDEEKEIDKIVSRVIQLEKEKQSIVKKSQSAKEEELKYLKAEYDHHDEIQRKLQSQYNIQDRMTDEQRESMEIVKKIGFIEAQNAKAKVEQKNADEKQAQALKEQIAMTKSLEQDIRDVHKVKLDILKIQEKLNQGSNITNAERQRLALLKNELSYAEKKQQLNEQTFRSEGRITNEVEQQLKAQQDIYNVEQGRVRNASKIEADQDKINRKLSEYDKITRGINQLQRDLIFAGMREQTIIESQVSALREKQDGLYKELRSVNAITDARQEEINAIEKAQREQMELNRIRQDAREKDRSFDDTGGLVDPYSTYMNMEQGARAILEPIARLDEALVGITKVADATDEQFAEFAKSSYDVGSGLGVTADQYMLAVEKWVTAGKTFSDSQDLGQVSMIGSFVGSISPDEMVKYMSVPLNAYKDAGLEATDVINTMNEVANLNAIEMNDLGKAYVRSATTAKNAGASYGELTGMITAAQEATRKGGERIGTGLKTIGINIQSIQSQWKFIDKKNFDYLENLGMDLLNGDGSAKTMTEVIGELVKVQDQLEPEEFSNAVKALAGKDHAETLQAIVDQWDTVQKVIGETEGELGRGEMGSAYIEHNKQADSVKFKLAELKNAWDELMFTVGGGQDGVVKILDVLITGLDKLNELAQNEELMRALKYILGGIAIHAGANLYRRFFDIIRTGFGSYIRLGKEAFQLTGDLINRSKKVKPPNGSTVVATGTPVKNTQSKKVATNNGSNVMLRTGSVGNLAKKAKETDKIVSKSVKNTDSKMRIAGRTLGKIASFIPIVGDAMLMLEFAGVPVFESIGSAVEGVGKKLGLVKDDTDKQIKAFEEMRENFQLTNGLINGDIEKMRDGFAEITALYDEVMSKDKNPDKKNTQAWFSEEEFLSFQEKFNAYSDSLGLDLKITINDTTHIEEQIASLKRAMQSLDAESVKDVTETIEKEIGLQEELTTDIVETQKLLDKNNADLADLYKRRDSLDPSMPNYEAQLETVNEYIARLEEKSEEYLAQIQETNQGIKESEDNVRSYAETLLSQGSALDTGKLKTAEATELLYQMGDAHRWMKTDIENSRLVQEHFNETNEITKEELEYLKELYPKVADAVGSASADEVSYNDKKRKAVKEAIEESINLSEQDLATAETAIILMARRAGMEDEIKESIRETGTVSKEQIDSMIAKILEIPMDTRPQVTTEGSVTNGAKNAWDMADRFKKLRNQDLKKTLTLTTVQQTFERVLPATSSLIKGKLGISSSVSSADGSEGSTSSASVSSASNVSSPPQVQAISVDRATSSSGNDDARVSSDVWRYWGTEMKLEDVTQSINNLSRQISNATNNEKELIKLYKQQNKELKNQEKHYKTLRKQQQSEMNSVLRDLRKHGFKTSGNDITNLSRSKSFKGDKATDVDGLLNTWRQLGTDMTGVTESIATLNETIKSNTEAMEQARIEQESKKFNSQMKRIQSLLSSVSTDDTISARISEAISSDDVELALSQTESAMNKSKANMSALISEFNKLSTATIKYEENGTELQSQLDSLGSSILTQADSIVTYGQSLNDLEINRVVNDLNDFNIAIDDNNSKLANNISNVKEGLLSGTDIKDLESAVSTGLDLSRDNVFEKSAKQRITLEKQVQYALDGFAKKNIDREKNVANSILKINSKLYGELLDMKDSYTNGKEIDYDQVQIAMKKIVGDSNDNNYGLAKELEAYFNNIKKQQDKLTNDYAKDMRKSSSMEEQDKISNQYIIDNIKLQEEYYKASINASKDAIKELNKQLKDSSLTDEQEQQIKSQIYSYEQSIIDTQNSIKSAINERLTFELSLMDEVFDKYEEYTSQLDYAMGIISSLGGDTADSIKVIYREMISAEKSRNNELANTINSLERQNSLYEEGSYEWNIINAEVDRYRGLLKDSNLELLEMNKNIMSNSFSSTIDRLEKSLFDGKTLEQLKTHQELWMKGLEREIALEDTYQRLADLGTKIHDEKMAQLAKQENLSRFEMDYLNKQLDILELQQKLDNLNQERTVQVLKQQTDGTWDWSYEADSSQLAETEKQLREAQLELQRKEQEAQEQYLSQLQQILESAEGGNFDSIAEFEKAIDNLGVAFETILEDFPSINDDYLNDLVKAYSHYIEDNQGILNDISTSFVSDKVFEEFSGDIVKVFDEISDNIGNSIANILLDKLPSYSTPSTSESTDKSISINLDKVEFPNIKTADGIEDAIMSLPQIALQKSREKI